MNDIAKFHICASMRAFLANTVFDVLPVLTAACCQHVFKLQSFTIIIDIGLDLLELLENVTDFPNSSVLAMLWLLLCLC